MWMAEAAETNIALWQEQTLWTDRKVHRKPPVQTIFVIGLKMSTWSSRSKVMLKDKWGRACPSSRTAGLPWGEPQSRGSLIDTQSIWNIKLTKWTEGQQIYESWKAQRTQGEQRGNIEKGTGIQGMGNHCFGDRVVVLTPKLMCFSIPLWG